MKMGKQIAIDGPAGVGKSTVAKLIAKKLGFIYVDTGAMYRGLAVFCNENNIDTLDEEKLGEIFKNVTCQIKYIDDKQHVIIDGKDVTDKLRNEETGKMASVISAKKAVRTALLDLQRKLANENDVVMDGRDIGTVILPNATLKIFLIASANVRAQRRYDELINKGEEADFDIILKEIEERDYRDMNREISPLKQADDAILVDTSEMNIDEVVDKICSLYSAQ